MIHESEFTKLQKRVLRALFDAYQEFEKLGQSAVHDLGEDPSQERQVNAQRPTAWVADGILGQFTKSNERYQMATNDLMSRGFVAHQINSRGEWFLRITFDGVKLFTPSTEPTREYAGPRGVSMLEAAMLIEMGDDENARLRKDKWLNKRSVTRPLSIGVHIEHAQQPIYEPAALVSFIEKAEKYLTISKVDFIKRLESIARPPRQYSSVEKTGVNPR